MTLTVHDLAPGAAGFDADGADLAAGLRADPKHIPPRYGYDAEGSRIYEELTALPTYYLTRTERALLERHGGEIAAASRCVDLVELGSGSAKKTRLLLEALRTTGRPDVRYLPVDISREMLEESTEALLAALPGLTAECVAGDYHNALAWIREHLDAPRMIAFLGSSIGNFPPEGIDALLGSIAQSTRPGDELLLGADLVSPAAKLEAAYNDPPGYDAFQRFRRNRLDNVNRLFDGNFDPDAFTSRAVWYPEREVVEAHLRAHGEQHVRLAALDLDVTIADGEELMVDISAKFDRGALAARLGAIGLDEAGAWVDAEHDYALLLYRRR